MYLLDTNILSHTAPTQRKPNAELVGWLRRNGDHCYLSAVTVLEISYGAAWLARKGSMRKAAGLQSWIRRVLAGHRDRILAVDEKVALRGGELMALARGSGIEVDVEDAMIAACAEIHGMIVLTGNTRHFAPMGVAHIDPFAALPPDASARV
ncbi:MAG TPA: type II toxin-antitoxin system VapC family toxin [Stellaceae bacterium]|nr:type II toxin-antitoxin system VapC family toxin [Stellaceae bacterium]